MALTVITNEHLGMLHLGNPDRDNPQYTYDRPEKLKGCLDAARQLAAKTGPNGTLRDGNGLFLPPIQFCETERLDIDAAILTVHPQSHIDGLDAAAQEARVSQSVVGSPYQNTFGREAAVSPFTPAAARSAVGASLDMVDRLIQSPPSETAFAVVWPPGHHAEPTLAMGFCYFSNAAIAAKYARDHAVQVRPGRRNRVVVIDVDHHRGNGTTAALAGESEIMVVDMVYRGAFDPKRGRYVDGTYDPATDRYINCGKEYPYLHDDPSIGAHAHPIAVAPNILSIEEGFTTPEHLVELYTSKVLPALRGFQPDIIIWSLGIDSAMGDILGGFGHIPSSFYTLIRGTRLALPQTRHGGVLEGGYDPSNWYSCLQPSLLGFHVDAADPKARSSFFRQRIAEFAPKD